MSDSHNIGIITKDKNDGRNIIWLYSHSGFYVADYVEGFAASLALALDEARPRWDDETYFTRIIVLTLGDSIRGISVDYATADEHKRWVIDTNEQKVMLVPNYPSWSNLSEMPEPILTLGYEDFIIKYKKHNKTYRREY